MLILLFILNILDRSNIGNAKIAGMSDDLNLTGLDYNNLVVFTFLGCVSARLPLWSGSCSSLTTLRTSCRYCVAQAGVGVIFAKGNPALWMAVAATSWGIVSSASSWPLLPVAAAVDADDRPPPSRQCAAGLPRTTRPWPSCAFWSASPRL